MQQKFKHIHVVNPSDKIWIPEDAILAVIKPPEQCGKSKRIFKVDKNDIDQTEKKFENIIR